MKWSKMALLVIVAAVSCRKGQNAPPDLPPDGSTDQSPTPTLTINNVGAGCKVVYWIAAGDPHVFYGESEVVTVAANTPMHFLADPISIDYRDATFSSNVSIAGGYNFYWVDGDATQVINVTCARRGPVLYWPEPHSPGCGIVLNQPSYRGVIINIDATGYDFAAGTAVTVQATVNPGYVFDGWTGADDNLANPTTFTMNADRAIAVSCVPSSTATWPIEIESNGGCAVEVLSGGSLLWSFRGLKSASISPATNQLLQLIGSPVDDGYGPAQWSRLQLPDGGTYDGGPYAEYQVTSGPNQSSPLVICPAVTTPASGTLSLTQDAGSACNATAMALGDSPAQQHALPYAFPIGTVVYVTAIPADGAHSFASWTGGTDVGGADPSNPTRVTISGDQSVGVNCP